MSPAPRKWRPSLVMVTAGMICVVLAVASAGFAIVRLNVNAAPAVELITALSIALIAAFAVGYVFVRAITRPLLELSDRARRISAGDQSAIRPMHYHGTRELAALSESFMSMAENLSSRSTYLRTYSRHVSHELKTPITAIRGAAELLLDTETMPPEQRRRFLQNILADISRMSELLDRLNEQALAENAAPGGAASVSDIAATLRDQFPSLDIVISGADDIKLALAPASLLMVLHHLAANAEQHSARKFFIEIAATDDNAAQLTITDDGSGISSGNKERVFDPFFTTRRDDGGTGMGLTIVRAMLEAHQSSIHLVETVAGARFQLRLPRAATDVHKIS